MPRRKESESTKRAARSEDKALLEVWDPPKKVSNALVAKHFKVAAGASVDPPRRYSDRRRAPSYDLGDLDIFLDSNRKRRKQAQGKRPRRPSGVPGPRDLSYPRREESLPFRAPHSASGSSTSNEGIRNIFRDTDPQEVYYREIGYFPSLDDEALELIEAVLEDPETAKRMSAANRRWRQGLELDRNVHLEPNTGLDPCTEGIRIMESKLPIESKESSEDQRLQEEVWRNDQSKCRDDNEALFQRTLMMAMIDRHRFFFDRRTAARNRYDFSAEKLWNCAPMPSRALESGDDLLSRPKPDLCICFRTKEVVPKDFMVEMPQATRDLAYFEGKEERAFPFLTIEAKKSYTTPDDEKALYQSLNCASQALHNMYEFFREAGDDATFFEEVRVFSVAAMSKGLRIRVHRAVETTGKRILPDYPLQFEYFDFMKADEQEFERQKVIDAFENIVWGYGPKLFDLLYRAAKVIAEKFERNKELKVERTEAYYRHNQRGGRRINSAVPSQADGDSVRGGTPSGRPAKRPRR